jgi:hypothetical protein
MQHANKTVQVKFFPELLAWNLNFDYEKNIFKHPLPV